MSLGAKELFHTNFLAFLLETDAPELENVRNGLTQLFFGEGCKGRVRTWRERHKFDLVVLPAPSGEGNGRQESEVKEWFTKVCDWDYPGDSEPVLSVIIEAKLKSVPTTDQLRAYNKKLKKGCDFELDESDVKTIVLPDREFNWTHTRLKLADNSEEDSLSLRGKIGNLGNNSSVLSISGRLKRILILPGSTSIDTEGWRCIGWREVAQAIARNVDTSNKSALTMIVDDYVKSLSSLLDVLDRVEGFVDYAMVNNLPYGLFYGAITDKIFRPLRIKDLVGKYAMSLLAERFLACLKNRVGDGTGVCWPRSLTFLLESYVHYSNEQPGLGIEWLVRNRPPNSKSEQRFSVGVQIQRAEYRHYMAIAGKVAPPLESWACTLGEMSGGGTSWWMPSDFSLSFSSKLPRDKADSHRFGAPVGDEREYYKFGNNDFIYTKAELGQTKLGDISELIRRSLESARGYLIAVEDKHVSAAKALSLFLAGSAPDTANPQAAP